MSIYLDNAASTPLSQKVKDVIVAYLNEQTGNPSGIHRHGVRQRSLIEKSRKSIAQNLNSSIGEIFFTSGGTESNNMVLKCAVLDRGVKNIITSPIEHPSIIKTVNFLKNNLGTNIIFLNPDAQGNINPQDLEEALKMVNGQETLVSLMHANNEIGTLYPINEYASIAKSNGALFHTDATQTVGHLPFDLENSEIDYLSASAHKFHGLKGTGILYMNSANPLHPYISGGGQERNVRAGTENVMGIISCAEALQEMTENMDRNRDKINQLRNQLKSGLQNLSSDIEFNGNQDDFLFTVLNVNFPASDMSDMLVPLLDIEGVSCSGGSACSSGSEGASHVISTIKPTNEGKAVRFSFSHLNTPEEIEEVLLKIKSVLAP